MSVAELGLTPKVEWKNNSLLALICESNVKQLIKTSGYLG